MAFMIDSEFLPATLTAHPISDGAFAALSAEHRDLRFEMSAEGELIVRAPNFSNTSAQNSEVDFQLRLWAKKNRRGVVVESSCGFVLPNGARRSPDVAWVLKSRIEQLKPSSRNGFWRLCPDFVIEIRSVSDRLRPLREKMDEYKSNGAQLGWLIDPRDRSVSIYRPGREVETLIGVDSVKGEGPVEGFVLNLGPVWDPLAG